MPSSNYKDSACKSSRHSQNQKFITWNGVVINNQDIEQFYGASHSCQVKTQPQTKYLLTKMTPLPKRALEMLAVNIKDHYQQVKIILCLLIITRDSLSFSYYHQKHVDVLWTVLSTCLSTLGTQISSIATMVVSFGLKGLNSF